MILASLNTAEQILVIFLSTALAVFLVIAIIAGILVVKLLKRVDDIAAKAQRAANFAEAVSEAVAQAAEKLSVLGFFRGVANMVNRATKSESKHKEKEEE